MLVDPSLRDALSPDLWIPGHTVWPGVRRSHHDAIQGVLVVAVALRQLIGRLAAPDAREGSKQMFIRQLHLANPRSQLPTWFNSARRTTTQLIMHLFTKLADAAIIWLAEDPLERRATIASSVTPGHQPSNATDQPHNRGMFQEKTTADSRLQSQLVCHKDSTVNLNARFDWSLALVTVGRTVPWQSPMHSGIRKIALTSDFVAGSPSACNTTSVCRHVSNVCATAATVSTDESFVDCIAITAPVERS